MSAEITAKAERFGALHDAPGIFVVPNPWDPGTARVLEAVGFEALATTSAGLAFSLARRDGEGAVTLDQTLDNAGAIAGATALPVTADLENGFADDPAGVAHTIRRAAQAGLVGASIEDATYDAGHPLYDRSLAIERIHAAAEAAHALPFRFTLTARTEGFIRERPDFDETIERLVAFESAGADVLYAPGLPDLASIRTVCAALRKPVNVVVGVGSTRVTLDELRDAGVRRVSTGSSLTRAAFAGLLAAAREIHEHGTFTFAHDTLRVADWNRYFRPSGG